MIDEQLTFGIDLGIGSCGWAVLRRSALLGEAGRIDGLGSWCFDVPETAQDRVPTNQVRRSNRLLRRVIRRRRKRMIDIRRLFHAHKLLPAADCDALKQPGLDPWQLRAKGLDEPLQPAELAVALAHIAKRRGFKSAAKRKAANATSDDTKMLAALNITQERLARYRTVGEMFARDPDFAARRRNRDGLFDRTVERQDLIHEVGKLFAAQRRLGQDIASVDLEEAFTAIAFRQLPMQDSEQLVGTCVFEPQEKRTARLAPSFERFRLLTRLVNLRVRTAGGERSLSPDELARATADLGKTAKITVKKIRGLIGLTADERFTTIKPEDEERDIALRTGEATAGTWALRKALGEALWAEASRRPDHLDAVAHALSFFETNQTIAARLREIGLSADVLDALLTALDAEAFAKFKGSGNLSTKACRKLIPHLEQGHRYDEACHLVGYNHAASAISGREQVTSKALFNELVAEVGSNIANPVARKALTEGLKQLWAMRNRWGLPGSIHIELTRDVGNSIEKRRELEQQIEKNTKQRDKERDEVRACLKITDIDSDTLLRYRLWKEQGGKCVYTGADIHITQVVATDNTVQVDHILPWSRFGDDSFNNKTLCLASANQRKKGQTPYEWFTRDASPDAWAVYTQRVETNHSLRGFKKRNYLLKNADEVAEKFRSRNLNDTRYASKLLAEAVKLFYPKGERQEKGGRRRVLTRPGALTSALRQAWGLEALKKVDGKRVEDARHHAIDALTVAAVGEAEVQRLTKSFQTWEQQGLGRPLRHVDPPWPGFRSHVLTAYDGILVARPERRRARGEGHQATIRQLLERDGETTTTERVAVLALGLDKGRFVEAKALKQLERIKDPERNAKTAEAIRAWISAGRPMDKDSLPRSPAGHVMTKIRLMSSTKPAVMVRHGSADRGNFVRIDVFTKPNAKGLDEYYLVPIYPHQIHLNSPPNFYIERGGKEVPLTDDHKFKMSIFNRSLVEIEKNKNRSIVSGYVTSFDRSVVAIKISAHNTMTPIEKKTGVKTVKRLSKYTVDRFGARAEIKSEVREWHGVACTSPSPPD